MIFGHLLTAMVTPFDEEGKIDLPALEPLIEHLIATGTEGLVVAGTTGESPTLRTEEKLTLFKRVKEITGNRVHVIAGTGTNDTSYSAELTRKAASIGIDGTMAVTPYYNKPNQEGMYHHFKTIAEATSLPLMIYNIPGRCMVNLQADTLIQLSKIPNITSVKEASGNLDQISEIIENTPLDFQVYSGDDSTTLPIMSIGGTGVVSVASHLIGMELTKMVKSFLSGNVVEASKLHRQLLPKMKACFRSPNPIPLKAILGHLGLVKNQTRSPLLPLEEKETKELLHVFNLA
ncbi:4-hydroxy-tetrahydrodipicolinate synthase [Alteribacillus iranensis]|uniref:4-hydroxy-tetrahydrodipicolinate synthase n=1 Tax=Alteribacillus iranensis TaxID=930128 RepID=UPI000B88CA3E|nr:4-hydroxy-tetrahydrodipicolinate synthase [Alteribacillus iranensis]